jgi:hypothetical protein
MSIRVALLLAACVAVAVAQPPQGPDQCDDEYECTCLPVDGHALRLWCLVGTCSRDVGEWAFSPARVLWPIFCVPFTGCRAGLPKPRSPDPWVTLHFHRPPCVHSDAMVARREHSLWVGR